jgi:hypothetical protein
MAGGNNNSSVEENDMAGLTPEAQEFYQKQYELMVADGARPSSLPTLLAYYRHVRGWFVK